MQFKIRMLTAAAALTIAAAAGAQAAGTPTGQVQSNVQATAPAAQAQPVVDEAARQPAETTDVATDSEVDASAEVPVSTQAQTGSQVPPEMQTQANVQAQTATQAQTSVPAGQVVAATAADVRAGVSVVDQNGAAIGTIESADADSAVVSTGSVRADIPIASFGKNSQGLVLAMTRAQLEAAAQARTPSG